MSEWAGFGLTDLQVTWMRESAISVEVARAAGLYSISDPKAAAKLFGRTPAQWAEHGPALAFPYCIPFQRDPVLVRGKPAKAFETRNRDGSVSFAKYVQAKNTGTHLYFGPSLISGNALRDVTIQLWITEGERKCLSAESAGLSCFAIPGVDQWHVKGERKLHPYFAHIALEGREVFLAFDADALGNSNVRRNELDLGRALEAAGAKVRIVRFPKDAQKLDDFLVRHERSELAALIAEARESGQLPPDTRGPSDNAWKEVWPKLRLDPENDRPVKDLDNVVRILAHHPAWKGVLAFDARRERVVLLRPPPYAEDVARANEKYPRQVSDQDAPRVLVWFAAQRELGWSIAPKIQVLEQAIDLVADLNRFDGVAGYLKPLKWDGMPRLDAMAVSHFGAADTTYHRTVVAKWMLSAVARSRTPGCQADHVLVLEGDQGIGKSTALQILAGAEYFSASLPEIGTKEAHEHCVGPWIVELAELDHMRKGEVTALKAFITERAPRFRHAYGRRTVEHPRRCVFAGTTNDEAYLQDATGNRRFWPVKCGRIDLEALRRDRDQLWAEAVHRVRNGEAWHITDAALNRQAAEAQQSRRTVDPWFDKTARFLEGRDQVTVAQMLEQMGIEPKLHDQKLANRMSSLLRECGWVRVQVRAGATSSRRVWAYQPRSSPLLFSTGDKVVTAQVVDIASKSPLSPVSPVEDSETQFSLNRSTETDGGDTSESARENVSDANQTFEHYTGDKPQNTVTTRNEGEILSPVYTGDKSPHTGDSPNGEVRQWRF